MQGGILAPDVLQNVALTSPLSAATELVAG
jgi:hypothetical protein